jgi:HEAT repeat protein
VNFFFAALVVGLRLLSRRRATRVESRRQFWQPKLIQLISDDSDPAGLSAGVDSAERRDVVEIAWDLARRLRGQDRTRVQQFAVPLLGVLDDDLGARRQETRARAVQIVSCLGGDAYEETVVAHLDDSSTLVSLVAARALAQPNRVQRIGGILDRLHRYDAWSQALLSSMLANVGSEATPAMRRYLEDDRNTSHSRAAVARALELLRDVEAADVAAQQLDSADGEVVAACLRLLSVVGRGIHAVGVRPLLTDDRFFIRSAAITTLGRIGVREDAEAIVQMVDGDSPWVAIRSAQALWDLHASDELAALVERGGLPAEAAIETLYGGAA